MNSVAMQEETRDGRLGGEASAHFSVEGFIESFDRRYPRDILDKLLKDRTTGDNIIWADDEYEELGDGYAPTNQITPELITGTNTGVIKPRLAKERERQSLRTKSRAEVFTPSWLCNRMNNVLDDEWFGRAGVFNVEDGLDWTIVTEGVEFSGDDGQGWRSYVRSSRLEITCGEAPFLCSRYDTVSGKYLPVPERIGILDRKLRVVSEQVSGRQEWGEWALAALKSVYGYEFQGDNLLIARINVFETFVEHLRDRWNEDPSEGELEQAAHIVSWNIWQMDGMTCTPPTDRDVGDQLSLFDSDVFDEPREQLSMFDFGIEVEAKEPPVVVPFCKIYDWKDDKPFEFASLRGKVRSDMGKFFAVIGNPPYQEEVEGNQRKSPIYNYFMDEAYKVSERTELVTPARFLFNAGQTPKEWNRKMLSDPHLKVIYFNPNGTEVFPNQQIKGGIAVTYRDVTQEFGAIGVFFPSDELKTIADKVKSLNTVSLSDIFVGAVPYSFTDAVRKEHPELVEEIGSSFDLRTNILDKLDGRLFFESQAPGVEYAAIYGLHKKHRESLWIERKFINVPANFNFFKVLLPKASGNGDYGEKLAEMSVAAKKVGHTQSFVSLGAFETEEEAKALAAYLKSKFARALLGICKVTQDITARVWEYVPLQNFTTDSDIDWSQSVAEIDRQLYRKYNLTNNEIEFIETHVQEMS